MSTLVEELTKEHKEILGTLRTIQQFGIGTAEGTPDRFLVR